MMSFGMPWTVSPEAYFDGLAAPIEAPRSIQPLSVSELHLFCYLACLLGMLRGNPTGDWGYQFSLTKEGYPFSAELNFAQQELVRKGFQSIDPTGLITFNPSRAHSELQIVQQVRNWGDRLDLLRTATDCALALPVGAIKSAFSRLPAVRVPSSLRQQKVLLEQDEVSLLHSEYKLVTELLGEQAQDNLAPAVIWLSARVLRHEEPPLAA